MELSKITEKARKKIDLPEFGEKEYLTIKPVPFRKKRELSQLQTKGLNLDLMRDTLLEEKVDTTDPKAFNEFMIKFSTNPVLAAQYITADYDPAQTEYKLKLAEYCIDQNNHSILDDSGKSLLLTASVIEDIASSYPELFDRIIKEIEKYNEEINLKK